MVAPHAIDAVGIAKSFGSTRAVAGASLRVEQGQLAALVGPSGSGKTTLLRIVAGFEVPDAGTVHVGGRCVAGGSVWEEPDRRRIGMVFQDGALFPHLTVAGNLAFSGATRARVEECLDLVALRARATSYPHELSGGERQRIALARALAADPDVVLLDEPFAALDEGLRASLRREVCAILRQAGASALLVTHNQEEALSLADVVGVMREGRIEQLGAPEEVYRRPTTRWVAEFLGDADVVPGTAGDGVVDSELGRFPADNGQRGHVNVVVRPEDLSLSPDDAATSADGRAAVVVGRSFFGHDQLVELELDSGLRVRSRTAGSASWRPGDRVLVRVIGPVNVLDAG
jgi:iron(III) transport system ATP-binding protein